MYLFRRCAITQRIDALDITCREIEKVESSGRVCLKSSSVQFSYMCVQHDLEI